jgi:hypothetical protein
MKRSSSSSTRCRPTTIVVSGIDLLASWSRLISYDSGSFTTIRGAVVVILQRGKQFGLGQERRIPGLARLESEPGAQGQGMGLFGNPVLLDIFKAQAQIDERLRRARRSQ